MSNVLVTYYSFSGATRGLAEQIAGQVSGDLLEILPEKPYVFDYNTASRQARAEIARGFCPALISGGRPIDGYDAVFIGTPNWFKSMAPPVLSFLRSYNFTGKTVVPFCTHGGGGFGEIERKMAEECPGAAFLPGFAASPVATAGEIETWLRNIGRRGVS